MKVINEGIPQPTPRPAIPFDPVGKTVCCLECKWRAEVEEADVNPPPDPVWWRRLLVYSAPLVRVRKSSVGKYHITLQQPCPNCGTDAPFGIYTHREQ